MTLVIGLDIVSAFIDAYKIEVTGSCELGVSKADHLYSSEGYWRSLSIISIDLACGGKTRRPREETD